MATFTGTGGADIANATTGTISGFSGGTAGELQDAIGDTFTGGDGADTVIAGNGNDTFNIATGDFDAGESINGGGGTDTITLTTTGDGQAVDYSIGTITNVESLTSVNQGSGNGYDQTFTVTAAQWAGLTSLNMNDGTDVLNVLASGDISADVTNPTVSNVETSNLTGTGGADAVTLSGIQLDAILVGTGTINLGAGGGDT